MWVPQNGCFIKEHLIKVDDDWGYPHDFGNLHIYISLWLIISWSITCYKNHPLSQETIPPKSPNIGGMCTILNCVVYYIVKKPALVLIPTYIYIYSLFIMVDWGWVYPALSWFITCCLSNPPSRSK